MPNKIQVEVVGDTSSLSRAFKSASKDASHFGSRVGSAIGSIAKAGAFAGIAAGVVGISAVLKAGIGEWQQQAKVASATAAILESTGGVAKVTAEQVSDLATSIMEKTGIDDEAIQSGENLLLTFQKIRNEAGKGNDVFNRATEAAVNLSSAGFGSMTSASKMLGKALNDPIGGLGALARVGVKFTEEQKNAIKAMVDSGDVLKAQTFILDQVEGKVGGVAEAYGKTLPGQINILKEQFNNLSGTIVGAVAPAFAKGLSATNDFIQKFSEADGAAEKFKVVAGTIRDAAVMAGEMLLKAFRSIDWTEVGRTLADGVERAFNFLVGVIRNANWGEIGRTAGRALVTALNTLADWLRQVDWNNVGHEMIQGMGRALEAFGRFLAGVNWGAVLGALVNGLTAFLKGLGSLLLGIGAELGGAVLKGLQKGATAAWQPVRAWFAGLPGQITGLFATASVWLLNVGWDIIKGLWNGLEAGFNRLKAWAAQKVADLVNTLTHPWKAFSPSQLMVDLGKNIMEGQAVGMQQGSRRVLSVVREHNKGLLAEINKLQAEIDKINRRREIEDANAAVRAAQLELNALRAKKNVKQAELTAAEDALGRAIEDRRLMWMNRELTQLQTHYDAIQTKRDAAEQKAQAARDKDDQQRQKELTARQKFFDAIHTQMQNALDRQVRLLDNARDRASKSFSRLADLIQRGFGAVSDTWVSPAQQAIDEITSRRNREDLAQAVSDAQARLKEAMKGDDPSAVADAQRALQRAQEDVKLASLQKQAEDEKRAHDQEVQAKKDALDQMLINLETSFTETGIKTKTGMDKVLGIINDYLGGFKKAGNVLGSGFADELRDAVQRAVDDANRIVSQQAGAATAAAKVAASATISAAVKLPLFQSGGVVGATGMAILHRGETVLPAGHSGGNTYVFNFPNYLGSKQELVQTIRTELGPRFERRNGRPAFGGAL